MNSLRTNLGIEIAATVSAWLVTFGALALIACLAGSAVAVATGLTFTILGGYARLRRLALGCARLALAPRGREVPAQARRDGRGREIVIDLAPGDYRRT